VNALKILEIFGLLLQIFAGGLFLLDQTLKYRNTTLNKFVEKLQEWLAAQLSKRWVMLALILIAAAVVVIIYFWLMLVQNAELKSVGEELPNLIIGFIFATMWVFLSYGVILNSLPKLVERWHLTGKLAREDRILSEFIHINKVGFLLCLILGGVIFIPVLFEPLRRNLWITVPAAFLVFSFGSASAVSLLIVIILSVLKYFASLSRKWFWTEVLIMWVVGGILLLIVACCN
jgi:hypothetical protein